MWEVDPECIHMTGYEEATPLMTACLNGQTEVVDFLLSSEVHQSSLTLSTFVNRE